MYTTESLAQETKSLVQAKASMELHGHDKRIVHAVHGGGKVFISILCVCVCFLQVSTSPSLSSQETNGEVELTW